jgi:uncharacterized metal-binding protein YceD (DUF177 family)
MNDLAPELSRPEFSRVVMLTKLGTERLRREIAATPGECAALARRFDLVTLDSLRARIELERQGGGTFLLRGEIEAQFAQTCVLTLDPVAGAVSESFVLRYGPPEAEPEDPGREDEPAFELLDGDVIDIGEAVAQEFALMLPPFPRAPDISVETEAEGLLDRGPFAELARLFPGGGH